MSPSACETGVRLCRRSSSSAEVDGGLSLSYALDDFGREGWERGVAWCCAELLGRKYGSLWDCAARTCGVPVLRVVCGPSLSIGRLSSKDGGGAGIGMEES